MSENHPAAVMILAAGEGTRMKSRTPKVLHPLCGRSTFGIRDFIRVPSPAARIMTAAG